MVPSVQILGLRFPSLLQGCKQKVIMTNKDKALHLAAQLDQIYRELEAIGQDKEESFVSSHQAGLCLSMIRSASRQIQALSRLLK